MHLADFSLGLLGAFAIVGAGIPVAVGAAMSAKERGTDQAAITFFGDGATNIGTFHEGLNMAAVWRAPVVFVIENNLYGEYTPMRKTTPLDDLADRAASYAIPGVVVDGQDVAAVRAVVAEALDRARAGDGPTLIEAKTYRYRGHASRDPGKYRPADEIATWRERDPIELLGAQLADEGVLSRTDQERHWDETRRRVDEAAAFAEAADYPTLEETEAYVYAS
jgi:pyruvate dehydrogenase E1 component alpha subunit